MDLPQEWDAYPTQLDKEFVMIVVNLGLDSVAPVSEYPFLIWLKAEFETMPGTILPVESERDVLNELEEELGKWADEADLALAGRLTGAGRREFFVYADTDRSEELLLRLENSFPQESFDVRGRRDDEWQLYREFLYPEPVAMQRIKNQRLIATLREHDASVEVPRSVTHRAYFHTEEAADDFAKFLDRDGFGALEVFEDEDAEDRAFGVRGTRTHAVDLATVDRIAIPLFVKVRELGGAYDGWECPVVDKI